MNSEKEATSPIAKWPPKQNEQWQTVNSVDRPSGEREAASPTADVMADRHWIAGAKVGWNYGQADNIDGLNQCIDARLKGIREEAASPTTPAVEELVKAAKEALKYFWTHRTQCNTFMEIKLSKIHDDLLAALNKRVRKRRKANEHTNYEVLRIFTPTRTPSGD